MFSDLNQNVRYRVYAIIPNEKDPDQRWYIGCTATLRIRLQRHTATGQWTYPFSWVILDKSEKSKQPWRFDRTAMENHWIRLFDPSMIRNANCIKL